ncbi:MAG: cytochrome-c oxidase [Bryobacteraceae bacterium]|nr:MAG: cytochrome-c oxidase [Bryobacteraceae bacterium]
MNRAWLLALGVFATIVASVTGLVLLPDRQLRGTQPVQDEDRGIALPAGYFGDAEEGRKVYMDLGCIYCHTQQVRPEGFGADIERGWGMRRSVARDYIHDEPPLMGTMRTGPDLMNIGARQPSEQWHYLHLYDPRITSPGSIMPPHRFLFEVRHSPDGLPEDAVRLPDEFAERKPAWIVPKERARWLVAYLKSLDHNYEVPEAR